LFIRLRWLSGVEASGVEASGVEATGAEATGVGVKATGIQICKISKNPVRLFFNLFL